MAVFDLIADSYDESIANGRFDYATALAHLMPFIKKSPLRIADLASGTGNMAHELHKQWPLAEIICEEPSGEMIKILKRKFPYFATHQKTLQNTEIKNQDLVTIAFNAINYIKPDEAGSVFRSIRAGMSKEGLLYFDALTTESAFAVLNGEPLIKKTSSRGKLTISHRLTPELLSHRFSIGNKKVEEHTQYLVSKQGYLTTLSSTNFKTLFAQPVPATMRTEFICEAI